MIHMSASLHLPCSLALSNHHNAHLFLSSPSHLLLLGSLSSLSPVGPPNSIMMTIPLVVRGGVEEERYGVLWEESVSNGFEERMGRGTFQGWITDGTEETSHAVTSLVVWNRTDKMRRAPHNLTHSFACLTWHGACKMESIDQLRMILRHYWFSHDSSVS